MFYPSGASKAKANSPQIKLAGMDTIEFHPTDNLRMNTAEHNCQSGRQYWMLPYATERARFATPENAMSETAAFPSDGSDTFPYSSGMSILDLIGEP